MRPGLRASIDGHDIGEVKSATYANPPPRQEPLARPGQPRPITDVELRTALDWAAHVRGAAKPTRPVLLGLVRAGLISCVRVGGMGAGRRYMLTSRGTVERIARMRA